GDSITPGIRSDVADLGVLIGPSCKLKPVCTIISSCRPPWRRTTTRVLRLTSLSLCRALFGIGPEWLLSCGHNFYRIFEPYPKLILNHAKKRIYKLKRSAVSKKR